MPEHTLVLKGMTASRFDAEGIVAIVVAQHRQVGNYHVYLLRSEAAEYLVSYLDDLTINAAAHRGTLIDHVMIDGWEKYPDEFMTEPSAHKYAKREMSELRKAGADNEPYYTGDASLDVAKAAPTEAMKQTLRGELPTGKPKPAVRRFGDSDDDFASRFEESQRMARAEARRNALPRPEMVGELPANAVAEIPTVRMESSDGASGGKFWEVMVYEASPEQMMGTMESRGWWVDVRFGAIGDRGQTRNVAKCATKGMAMDVRRERMNKKRAKGYREVTR